MSTVYNPESEMVTQIERLEVEGRDLRRKIELAHNENDKRVMNRQLQEIREEIAFLQARLA
jgi:hypothetical protein